MQEGHNGGGDQPSEYDGPQSPLPDTGDTSAQTAAETPPVQDAAATPAHDTEVLTTPGGQPPGPDTGAPTAVEAGGWIPLPGDTAAGPNQPGGYRPPGDSAQPGGYAQPAGQSQAGEYAQSQQPGYGQPGYGQPGYGSNAAASAGR